MDARVTAVIGIMHESWARHPSIGVLSKSVNLSPTRLRQLFQSEIRKSPMQYLRELRMQKAECLLSATFLSVKEVAFACGVKHVSSFVHAFKKCHGMTPGKFRLRSGGSR
jgi:transcriptional regulator GlxA family with amidase domain